MILARMITIDRYVKSKILCFILHSEVIFATPFSENAHTATTVDFIKIYMYLHNNGAIKVIIKDVI